MTSSNNSINVMAQSRHPSFWLTARQREQGSPEVAKSEARSSSHEAERPNPNQWHDAIPTARAWTKLHHLQLPRQHCGDHPLRADQALTVIAKTAQT